MADPNRTPPPKDRSPNDEDRSPQPREPASIPQDQGERIRRRRTGDDEPLTDEVRSDIGEEISDEGLGRSDR